MYCDFYSVADKTDWIPRFTKALVREIETSPFTNRDWTINTVFFGGGTPTMLGALAIKKILATLNRRFDLTKVREMTIETNPGEVKPELLAKLLTLGFNRLSIGVQSLHDRHLQFLTRIHSVAQASDTFKAARAAGFDNINCDLIYNLLDQTIAEWRSDLAEVCSWGANHISAYALTVEPATPLHQLVKNKQVSLPDEDLSVEFFSTTHAVLKKAGYPAYEISNFSRPRWECRHNLHYWKGHPYLGFGPSAHGYDGRIRWNNISGLESYVARLEAGEPATARQTRLTERQQVNDILGFGLRLSAGVDLKAIPCSWGREIDARYLRLAELYPGCLMRTAKGFRLTQKGRLFADAIAADLTLEKTPK